MGKQNEPWGMVIVGGKDQALTVKLGRIKAYSPAEHAGLKEWDYVHTVNGQEVFEMTHNQICGIIKSSGNSLQMVVERGDHIVPNFEEIWPSNQDNCPIECYDEAVIEEMTEDREMLTNPDLVEARKDLKKERGENPLISQKMMKFDPRKSNILTTLAAEEAQKVTRTA